MFKVADCPGQVGVYGIVNLNTSVWSIFSTYLCVEIVESRSEERENIEAPVHPTSQALPLFQ